MKILIICHSYFPELTPRAFRWTAIAEELFRLGHHVVVICGRGTSTTERECLNGVEIHRTGSNARGLVKRWLRLEATLAPAIASTTVGTPVSIRSRMGRLFKLAYHHTVGKILWPDSAAFWYYSALKRAHEIQQQSRADVMVSVSLPYTAHLVGYKLKRYYSINWLVDIGDPFSFMTETPVNNTVLFRGLNTRSESSVLGLADAVAVTNEETLRKYLKYFDTMQPNKITVIPPVFVQPTSSDGLIYSDAKSNKIRLVFAGTLYRSIRNPSALLKFFRNLLAISMSEQFELHFYGVINDCETCFNEYIDLIDSKIFIHGLISRDKALRAMQEANILVNLGNSTAYQLPSKVIEYMIMGKPVLNITKLKLDSSQIFFSDFIGLCNVTEHALTSDSVEFARVKHFLENPPLVDNSGIAQLLKVHSVQAVTQNYLTLIQTMSAGAKGKAT